MLDVIAVAPATILCHEVAVKTETRHRELLVMERTETGKPRHGECHVMSFLSESGQHTAYFV